MGKEEFDRRLIYCRLCIKYEGSVQIYSKFNSKTPKYAQLISNLVENYFDFQKKNDDFPKTICFECAEFLVKIYNFKRKIMESHDNLLNWRLAKRTSTPRRHFKLYNLNMGKIMNNEELDSDSRIPNDADTVATPEKIEIKTENTNEQFTIAENSSKHQEFSSDADECVKQLTSKIEHILTRNDFDPLSASNLNDDVNIDSTTKYKFLRRPILGTKFLPKSQEDLWKRKLRKFLSNQTQTETISENKKTRKRNKKFLKIFKENTTIDQEKEALTQRIDCRSGIEKFKIKIDLLSSPPSRSNDNRTDENCDELINFNEKFDDTNIESTMLREEEKMFKYEDFMENSNETNDEEFVEEIEIDRKSFDENSDYSLLEIENNDARSITNITELRDEKYFHSSSEVRANSSDVFKIKLLSPEQERNWQIKLSKLVADTSKKEKTNSGTLKTVFKEEEVRKKDEEKTKMMYKSIMRRFKRVNHALYPRNKKLSIQEEELWTQKIKNLVSGSMDNHSLKTSGLCEYCGQTRSHLESHMYQHTGELNFSCNYCGKKFGSHRSVKTHEVNYHTDVKIYRCEICEKIFKRKSNLKMHVSIHTDTKDYLCEICEKKFIGKHRLDDHFRKVHQNGPSNFKCYICHKTFKCGSGHRKHCRVHHGGKGLKPEGLHPDFKYTSNKYLSSIIIKN